jgi:acetyl esterase/lipase
LDDGIKLAKRLRENGAYHELIVIDNGSCHGFLNMCSFNDESYEATTKVADLLKSLLISKPKNNQLIFY